MIDNKCNSSLTYEGVVNVKVINNKTKKVKRKYTIHNKGTKTLFYFLCNCLAKVYDNDYAPLAIDLANDNGNMNDDGSFKDSALAYRILLSKATVLKNLKIILDNNLELNYDYVTNFTAIIPYSAILSDNNDNDGKTIKQILLHSKLNKDDTIGTLLAFTNIGDNEEGIKITSGEALLIEWNLGFVNPKE